MHVTGFSQKKIPDMIHTQMSMYKCVQMDLHFLVYEYVKLFTKALFATVLTGRRVVTYQYWSDRFYRKPQNTSPEHFLESNPNTFIHTNKSLLYIPPQA